MSDTHELATVEIEPIADPGLPAHEPRPTDVDEIAEKRAERQVADLFGLSTVFTLLFCVSYFWFEIGEDPDVILGFGASNAALGDLPRPRAPAHRRGRDPVGTQADGRRRDRGVPPPGDPPARRTARTPSRSWPRGREESGIARRPLIRNSLLGAMGALGLVAIIPLRDLGPLPGDKLFHTIWKKGMRVVQDVDGTPIRPSDMEIGQLVNGQPGIFFEEDSEGHPVIEGVDLQVQKAKAAVVIVRMQPDDITPSKGRENWGVDGILCYSKICTHVGCPISLWEQQTHNLLCPCHQSTFDLADNGRVVFGPAARAVPQLPLALDDEGYLIATSDFTEPVGPSFWERG